MDHFISFLSENPNMLKRNFSATYTNKIDRKLWVKMANELNNIEVNGEKGSQKSVDEWRTCVSSFKNKAKGKAKEVYKSQIKTGVGEADVDYSSLTPRKMKFLNILGGPADVVEGEPVKNAELGIAAPSGAKQVVRSLFPVTIEEVVDEQPTSSQLSPNIQIRYSADEDHDVQFIDDIPPKSIPTQFSPERLVISEDENETRCMEKKTVDDTKRKNVMLRKQQRSAKKKRSSLQTPGKKNEESLKIQREMCSYLKMSAEAAMLQARAIEKFVQDHSS